MGDLRAIAFGVGLQDGISPCIFMTCGIFILLGLWAEQRSFPVLWIRIIFVLVYVLCALVSNFGPGQIIVFQKVFMLIAKILYFILGLGAFILGILFLKDWILLTRGLTATEGVKRVIKPSIGGVLLAFFLTVIAASVLSATATLWPINTYFMLLGSEMFLRGLWHTVILLLIVYILASLWPLWFVWAFLNIKKLRPSLMKIFCAAIFFLASTSIVFLFKF